MVAVSRMQEAQTVNNADLQSNVSFACRRRGAPWLNQGEEADWAPPLLVKASVQTDQGSQYVMHALWTQS